MIQSAKGTMWKSDTHDISPLKKQNVFLTVSVFQVTPRVFQWLLPFGETPEASLFLFLHLWFNRCLIVLPIFVFLCFYLKLTV